MIYLNKEEQSRLIQFSKDRNTIEALKKLFLNCFIRGKAASQDIELLAKAFKELEGLQQAKPEDKIKGQVGL